MAYWRSAAERTDALVARISASAAVRPGRDSRETLREELRNAESGAGEATLSRICNDADRDTEAPETEDCAKLASGSRFAHRAAFVVGDPTEYAMSSRDNEVPLSVSLPTRCKRSPLSSTSAPGGDIGGVDCGVGEKRMWPFLVRAGGGVKGSWSCAV